MTPIEKYCEYLYHAMYIPIYLYHNQSLAAYFPAQNNNTLPPVKYLATLWNTQSLMSLTNTNIYSYYGCIHIENSNSCIVIGPVNNLSYTNDHFLNMRREYPITNMESFTNFFHQIPTTNIYAFHNILLLINFTLNHKEMTWKDIDGYIEHNYDSTLRGNSEWEDSQTGGDTSLMFAPAMSKKLKRYIETGNVTALKNLLQSPSNIVIGNMSNTKIRHQKNLCIATISFASNAAIEGGLPVQQVSQLVETYFQHLERQTEPNMIANVAEQAAIDFASRVAASKIPLGADPLIRKTLQYIRSHVNQDITTSEVATYIGISRTYLSGKFKKDTGIDLSRFIRQCKLEEAKDLLAYSRKSISEISNLLCFSSQSHFQTLFKQQFGITPQSYRKSEKPE